MVRQGKKHLYIGISKYSDLVTIQVPLKSQNMALKRTLTIHHLIIHQHIN